MATTVRRKPVFNVVLWSREGQQWLPYRACSSLADALACAESALGGNRPGEWRLVLSDGSPGDVYDRLWMLAPPGGVTEVYR